MGNCLVTKLKGSVDNPYLPKLGEFKITVTPVEEVTSKSGFLRITADSEVTIYSADGSNVLYVDNPSNLINTISGVNITIYILNTACTLMVTNKYAITGIYAYEGNKGFSLEDLRYSPLIIADLTRNPKVTGNITALKNLQNASIYGCTGVFGNIKDLPSSLVRLSTSTLEGSLSELNTPNITHLYLESSSVAGNISSLSNKISLTELDLSANMEGSIESLVEGLCANNKAVGSTLRVSSTTAYQVKVTINGHAWGTIGGSTLITFTETGATTEGYEGGRTYNKSTGTWS